MASPNVPNVYNSTATQLTRVAGSTQTEKLFHEALADVQADTTSSSVLDKLCSCTTADELRDAFMVERGNSRLWGTKETKWTRPTEGIVVLIASFTRFKDTITNFISIGTSHHQEPVRPVSSI
jgi:hypothetical protein